MTVFVPAERVDPNKNQHLLAGVTFHDKVLGRQFRDRLIPVPNGYLYERIAA